MSSRRRPLVSAAAIAALAVMVLAVGLVALPSPASARPNSGPTALLLTVAKGENTDSVNRAAVLGCAPVRGSHPAAQQACRQLSAVAGDVSALSDDSGFCTLIYDPVTVTLQGLWQGQRKFFRSTYSNSCVLHRQTRAVFDF